MTSEKRVKNTVIDARLIDALLVLTELSSAQLKPFCELMRFWPGVEVIEKAVLRLDQLHEAIEALHHHYLIGPR